MKGAAVPDAAGELTRLADAYWDAAMEYSPVNATAYGDRRWDDRMDDRSPQAREQQRRTLQALLDGIRALAGTADAAGRLDESDRITASVLRHQLEDDLTDLSCDLEDWTVDPLEGPQVQIFNIESFQPIESPAEGRAMIARWSAMGPYLDQYLANLRRGLADGRVAVHAPVERVIDALSGLLAESDETWALLNPAREEHPTWSPADHRSFGDGLRDAVATSVRPALARLREALVTEILPRTRPDTEPGIAGLPRGLEVYGRLVRYHTSLDVSADELHRLGLAQVDRINAELEELGERALGTRDRPGIIERLRSDPALHFETSEQIVETAERSLARARAATPAWFGLLPKADCVVVPMGEHEARHGTVAYYRQPAPDGSRPGQYYINTIDPETRPRYEAQALAFHESIPGHHLQIAIAQQIDLPEFRRHLGVMAFWEGWGLYTERLANEMGLYDSDIDRLGMLSLDSWRACRLVVDTGMHAFGWSRARAIEFMLANSALAPNNIANEVDRYIVWPGQALAYKVGQIEILRLRDEARARLGPAFDIRSFHDAVLSGGALPLPTLREVVEARLGPA